MAKEYSVDDLKRDLLPIMKRMPSYAKLITLLARDPRISRADKTKLAAGLGYMISPIDLIPGIIPILGQLDDVLAVLLVLNNVVSSSPEAIVDPYLAETGLSAQLIKEDITTAKRVLKDLSVTLAKKTGRGLLKVGRYVGRKIAGAASRKPPKSPNTSGTAKS